MSIYGFDVKKTMAGLKKKNDYVKKYDLNNISEESI